MPDAPSLHPLILQIPESDRPRERLLSQGSGAVSDAELLAILLRTGRAGVSALGLAATLLAEGGGLLGLLEATPQTLRRAGIGPAKAATLLAALEIGRRLARIEMPRREPLTHAAATARYLALRYRQRDQEVMGALFLDSRQRLLGEREIFRGTIHHVFAEPREILKDCLLRGAAGFILFHTHPSGDPTPSGEDFAFTRRMFDAATAVGLKMVDHLILGTGSWVSLKERGAW